MRKRVTWRVKRKERMAEKLTEKERFRNKESLKISTCRTQYFSWLDVVNLAKRTIQKSRQIDRVIMETATQNNVYRTFLTRVFVTRTFVIRSFATRTFVTRTFCDPDILWPGLLWPRRLLTHLCWSLAWVFFISSSSTTILCFCNRKRTFWYQC